MNIETAVKSAFDHYKAGRPDEAWNLCRKILKRQPNNFDILNLFGVLHYQKKDYDSALEYWKKAVAINPSNVEVLHNLGLVFYNTGQFDEAASYFKKAVSLNPFHSDAFANLGSSVFQKGLLVEAEDYFRKALQLNPYHLNACNNLGTVLLTLGKYQEALQFFRRSVSLKPDSPLAHFHLSFVLLLVGDFQNGWKEYFWRWGIDQFKIPNWPQPIWDGSNFQGKTLFVHIEQGFGDMIQIVRYIPLVASRGGKIILQCQKELMPLIKHVEGVENIIPLGDPLPLFDIHCPLLCLPMIFDTNLDTIPANVPYIRADDFLVKKWKEKVGNTSSAKVGVIWQGNPVHKRDRERSIPFDKLAPLAKISGVSFYSLQKGEGSEKAKDLSCGLQLIDFMDEVRDFSDTAALIENLDLVISVDTSVAHLAGAMGKPVWALIQFSPDWRWLLERADSPWYPTMRLFRQPAFGDWDSVIRRVEEELRALYKDNHVTEAPDEKKVKEDSVCDAIRSSQGVGTIDSAGPVEQGEFVRAHYVLRLTDKSICDYSFINGPIIFKPGEGQFIRGIENALKTMIPREFKSIKILASDAFGDYDPKLVAVRSKRDLPGNVQIGQVLQIRHPDGLMSSLRIVDIRDGMVVLDANHPLAGKDLLLDVLLLARGQNAEELSDDARYRLMIENIKSLDNPEKAVDAMTQHACDQRILISVPAFNRKNITQLCLSQIQRYKTSNCFLQVYNDHSTEYDNGFLLNYADEAIQMPHKMGIHNLRLYQLRKFLQSGFDFIYLTDNDVIHDPGFIRMLIFLYELGEKQFPVCIYNTMYHMQPGIILYQNNFILLKRTAPGVSMFFDRKMVETIIEVLDNTGEYQADFGFDYRVIAYLDRPVITSVTSYLEHFGAGGINNPDFEKDRALNPTKYLQEKREAIIDYLTGKIPSEGVTFQKLL